MLCYTRLKCLLCSQIAENVHTSKNDSAKMQDRMNDVQALYSYLRHASATVYHHKPEMVLRSLISAHLNLVELYTIRYKMHTLSTPEYLEKCCLSHRRHFLKDKAWMHYGVTFIFEV